jgi:deoxyribodipyrimidine photolyase-related protein
MDGDQPAGGAWNFDKENRAGFGRGGPGAIPPPPRFPPDAITREVIALVEKRFADHPGSLASFAWPVTRAQGLEALERFVRERLHSFGRYQDAMWTGTPFGWHSLLSAALNLKLLDPREVLAAAEQAWLRERRPIASVEGFVRQILGWREFVHGVYWLDMPGLAEANHFRHEQPLPKWYWTGDTGMNCMRDVIGQTLEHGYAHHIERLMVTGVFGLLAGVLPKAVCDWYLAVYVDAVEWVELPNTAGMALYANGGRFTSKPYVASGAYIKRMSNYCNGCRYKPEVREGPEACPFTVLYWDFLARHERELAGNQRTALMVRNLGRLGAGERSAVRREADRILTGLDAL